MPKTEGGPVVLLVIDYSNDWTDIFRKQTLQNGQKILVEQTQWKLIRLHTCPEKGCWLYLLDDPYDDSQKPHLCKPDMCLIRNFPIDLHENDFKNVLMGMMVAGLPSINSLHSIFMGMHRPIQIGELQKAGQRINENNRKSGFPSEQDFQVVPIRYNPNNVNPEADRQIKTKMSDLVFPMVVKVGTTHAGFGKMCIKNKQDYDDFASVLAMKKEYFTMEPFIEHEYEYRIQKIGDSYRCFKRNSDTSWKNNWGNLKFVDHPVEEHHKRWIDECATMFGGMELTALDVLHQSNGRDVVLEMNDTAFGLMYEHEREDTEKIRDVVLKKMNELFI
eukprot:Lithocolla_globosa_v1_NODE_5973_length_1154_cov_64.965455.p1 type:complete len:332 gc:universal NODE_5973_length_1154_cov_64.965455:1098-103(-)